MPTHTERSTRSMGNARRQQARGGGGDIQQFNGGNENEEGGQSNAFQTQVNGDDLSDDNNLDESSKGSDVQSEEDEEQPPTVVMLPTRIIQQPHRNAQQDRENTRSERVQVRASLRKVVKPQPFTFQPDHMPPSTTQQQYHTLSEYERTMNKRNLDKYNEKRDAHKKKLDDMKKDAVAKGTKFNNRMCPFRLNEPRQSSTASERVDHIFDPTLNGLLSVEHTKVNQYDGIGYSSQYHDYSSSEVKGRVGSPHFIPAIEAYYVDITILGIQSGIKRLHDEWFVAHSLCCYPEASDSEPVQEPQARDLESFQEQQPVLVQDVDALADSAIVPMSAVCNIEYDSPEMMSYCTARGHFFYCAHLMGCRRHKQWFKTQLKLAGGWDNMARRRQFNAHFREFEKHLIDKKVKLQLFACCRATIKGKGRRRQLSQLAIDGYVVGVNPPGKDELIILGQWQSSLMLGTGCIGRCRMIAQDFHSRTSSSLDVVTKAYDPSGQVAEDMRYCFGLARTAPANDVDVHTDYDKLVAFLSAKRCNVPGNYHITTVISHNRYEAPTWNIQGGINAYSSFTVYSTEAMGSTLRNRLRHMFKDIVRATGFKFPVKKLSAYDADSITAQIMKGLSPRNCRDEFVAKVKRRMQTQLGLIGEVPFAALMHPTVARLDTDFEGSKRKMRTLVLELLQRLTIFVDQYSDQYCKFRGDNHHYALRCRDCGAHLFANKGLSLVQAWWLAPVVAGLHFGVIINDGVDGPHFDLCSSRQSLSKRISFINRVEKVSLCPALVEGNGISRHKSAHALLDAARIDAHSPAQIQESTFTRKLMESYFEFPKKAEDTVMPQGDRELKDLDHSRSDEIDGKHCDYASSEEQILWRMNKAFDDTSRRAIAYNNDKIERITSDIVKRSGGEITHDEIISSDCYKPFTNITGRTTIHTASKVAPEKRLFQCQKQQISYTPPGIDWKNLRPIEVELYKNTNVLFYGKGWTETLLNSHFGGRDREEEKYCSLSKLTPAQTTKMILEDTTLIKNMTHVKLIRNPQMHDTGQLPPCLRHEFWWRSRNAKRCLYYIIRSDLSSIRSSTNPLEQTLGQTFLRQNEEWAADRLPIGLLSKSFVDNIKAGDEYKQIPEEDMQFIREKYNQLESQRIVQLQSYSKHHDLWRVKVQGMDEWQYMHGKQLMIEDLLEDESYNLDLFTSMMVQGIHSTLVLGAGAKKSSNEPDTTGSNDSFPLPFRDGEKPIDIYWNLGSNDNNLCSRAAITNIMAGLGSIEMAEKVRIASYQIPSEIVSKAGNNARLPKNSVCANEVDYSLWLFRTVCRGNFTTLQCGIKWSAKTLIEKTQALQHPVLIEIMGSQSVRSHVIVLFQRHIFCAESMTTYPMCIENLNHSCGSVGHFDHACRVVGLIPERQLRVKYNAVSDNKEVHWDQTEFEKFNPRKKRRKKKKRKLSGELNYI